MSLSGLRLVRQLVFVLDAKSFSAVQHGSYFMPIPSKKTFLVALTKNAQCREHSHVSSLGGAAVNRYIKRIPAHDDGRFDRRDSWHDINHGGIEDRRTFKSVLELPTPEPRVTKTDQIKEFQRDFADCFPELRADAMKHLRHEDGFEVIMDVSWKDLIRNMPYQSIFSLLAPIQCFYLSKWAVFYLGIPPAEAIVMGTSLALFVIYKYASSICIIKQNPVTSTYAAVFPYKFLFREMKFRRNHVRPISTLTDFFSSCHVTIKGKKAFCPRSCFTTTHHYEELLRSSKSNEMKNKL